MSAKHFSLGVDDIAGFILDIVFEKAVDVHVAEEAYALTIFFIGVGQFVTMSEFTDLRLL